MFQPGQVVGGKYRLDKVIGQGAFATVWAATNTLIERSVALKILAEAPARRPTTVARFLKEAKICATPIHPTMIRVQDLGQTDEGLPYLVMELLIGHTLDQVLRAKGSLPWTMVVEVMQHVLSGLAAAHERNIIHRDVKPSNIFLVDGVCDGPPVKVLDLGLARDLTDDKRLTRTGQVVGTANYLPPETLLDEQPKGGTKAGDVFAAGMVLFVSLTGHFPFLISTEVATPAAEVFARASFYKSRAPLPGPAEFDRSLPSPLDRVIRRALDINAAQRYRDAGEMLADLERATQAILPRTSKVELSKNLAETCLGLPSFLADADLIQSGEAELIEPFAGLGLAVASSPPAPAAASPLPPGLRSSPVPPLPGASPRPPAVQGSSPPAMQSSPPMAKTFAARPIMMVDGSPAPPAPDSARESRASSSFPPSRTSTPGGEGRSRLTSGGSRPSWIRQSRIGLSLVGIAVGTLMGVLLLGGIVLWRLASRPQAVIATQPRVELPTTLPEAPLVEMAEMELRGLPEGARVRLDGQPVEGAVLRGVPGSTAVLVIEAPSFEPLRLELTFELGRTVDVTALLRHDE